MYPIYEQFLKNFQATNLEGCQQLINQPKFNVITDFTLKEFSDKLNVPILLTCGSSNSSNDSDTLNILQLIARLGKQWSSPLITLILDLGVDPDLQTTNG